MTLVLNKEELTDYLAQVFPQIRDDFAIDELTEDTITMRLLTASGTCAPAAPCRGRRCSRWPMSRSTRWCWRGWGKGAGGDHQLLDGLHAQPESGRDVIAHCRLLKLGRVLAVGDVLMASEGSDKPVARASLTYSIPPR